MIPVTSFAARRSPCFGLGGSGLASCHALKAGGAEVIAADDSADNVAKAAQAGFITADLRTVSWANFAALVLTPGVPLTHPAPHWSVLMARAGRRRGDRRHRAVLPRAPPSRARRAVRRDHRHQRQVDHDRADRASDEGRRLRHPDGRQYRHRDPVAGAAADGPRARDRDVVLPDRPHALARSLRRHPAQCQRGPHRPPRHAGALRRGQGAPRRRRAAAGTAIIGVDDVWCRNIADRLDRAGKRVVRISVKNPLADGIYVERETIVRAAGGARSEVARLGGIGSLRGLHNAQNAACAVGLRAGDGRLRPMSCKTACAAFPAWRTAWSRSAAAATCCSSTTPRAPMPMPRRMRCRPLPISSGSPAASRRPAASPA